MTPTKEPVATRRVKFCGALNGSVQRRIGETNEQAIERAQNQILNALDARAKSLDVNVGLEPEE